jgi:hypothetical protein
VSRDGAAHPKQLRRSVWSIQQNAFDGRQQVHFLEGLNLALGKLTRRKRRIRFSLFVIFVAF